MTAQTEALHAGAFIVTEQPGRLSRSVATAKGGNTFVAGQILAFDGNHRLIPYPGFGSAAGIMFDAVDASGGDITGAVYLDFGAEVRRADLTYPSVSTDGDDVTNADTALAALFIKAR